MFPYPSTTDFTYKDVFSDTTSFVCCKHILRLFISIIKVSLVSDIFYFKVLCQSLFYWNQNLFLNLIKENLCVCVYIYKYTHKNMDCIYIIGLISRVFANGLGGRGSIPGRVIPKTQKMLLDAALLNTQYYKVWIKIFKSMYLLNLSTMSRMWYKVNFFN